MTFQYVSVDWHSSEAASAWWWSAGAEPGEAAKGILHVKKKIQVGGGAAGFAKASR